MALLVQSVWVCRLGVVSGGGGVVGSGLMVGRGWCVVGSRLVVGGGRSMVPETRVDEMLRCKQLTWHLRGRRRLVGRRGGLVRSRRVMRGRVGLAVSVQNMIMINDSVYTHGFVVWTRSATFSLMSRWQFTRGGASWAPHGSRSLPRT